jgi:hypothetical protein
MNIKFTRIVLELLNQIQDKSDIKLDDKFINDFMKYKVENRLGIYNELKKVIKETDNDFTEYNYTRKFNKDEINNYLKEFFQFIETNKLFK